MSCVRYRMFLNVTAATSDQFARFEDITIEQEMDMACRWPIRCAPVYIDYRRVERRERSVSAGHAPHPARGADSAPPGCLSSTARSSMSKGANSTSPGKSMLTLVVSDDSFYLHRDESGQAFSGLPTIRSRGRFTKRFRRSPLLTSIRGSAPSNLAFDTTVCAAHRWNSAATGAAATYACLRRVPANSPGASVGYFKARSQPYKGLRACSHDPAG